MKDVEIKKMLKLNKEALEEMKKGNWDNLKLITD
jgi:hypothetical protein